MHKFEIAWWMWLTIGGAFGLYVNNGLTRHVCHWLLIRVLRGWIWLLQRTDSYWHEAPREKPARTQAHVKAASGAVEATNDELKEWLAKNPALKVVEK